MMKNLRLWICLATVMLLLTGCGNDKEGDEPRVDPQVPVYSLEKPKDLRAVDLGLSVLWASCNLGASSPEEYGGYFAWGDPTGALWSADGIGWNENGYTWDTGNYGGKYPWSNIGGTSQDVVTTHWSSGWRTPDVTEAAELCNYCQWILHDEGGTKWYEVVGPNGNSIILPLGGYYDDDPQNATHRFLEGPVETNVAGYYWTSSICPSTMMNEEARGYAVNSGIKTAWLFVCNSELGDITELGKFTDFLRAFHMSIRPVRSK
ncbi:MAG: hypothetical protein SPL96_05075 [Bacteroidales bacterium]|nr:hypothetical protein [Bacteroidales bacterium]